MKNLTFFLGGYDLEMLTIRELINAEGLPYFDGELDWSSATVIAYKEGIRATRLRGNTPVLVELRIDPKNESDRELSDGAIIVDHHGPRAGENEPTSLEQVFKLLELPQERWTRWMDLVSANDRGHVPAMQLRGATTEEMAAIRAEDRRAQGMTPEEEAEAERGIANRELLFWDTLAIVRISHHRSSAVADKIEPILGGPGPVNCIVVSPDEINVYAVGALIEALLVRFPKELGSWSGGNMPKRGYWGLKHVDATEVVEVCCSALGLTLAFGDPANKPGSFSRFVLPFAYSTQPYKGPASDIHFKAHEPEELPARCKYLTHETARVLFDRAGWFELEAADEPKTAEDCKKMANGDTVKEKACMDKKGQILALKLKFSVSEGREISVGVAPPRLILFEDKALATKHKPSQDLDRTQNPDLLQVGFLILELFFADGQNGVVELSDLLKLNELFRYWQEPFSGHKVENMDALASELFQQLGRQWRLADSKTEHDCYFSRWEDLLQIPVQMKPNEWVSLVPKCWQEEARSFVLGNTADVDKSRGWAVYADNRSFVWTCALLSGGGNQLRKAVSSPGEPASELGHWIKLLNVDTPRGSRDEVHHTTEFERDWAHCRTYRRWEEWGTFYGFSYHSGAMLGPVLKNSPLWKHFGQMYFDQVMLLLYVRVVLFRFSERLTTISSKARDTERDSRKHDKWQEDFSDLRWAFVLFTNLYRFPLLSNQQQGVEMYAKAREAMDVDELFGEVQKEIQDCQEYIEMEKTSELTHKTTLLTAVATIGLTLSLVIAFGSMDAVKSFGYVPNLFAWIFMSIVLVVFILILSASLVFWRGIMDFVEWLAKLRKKKNEQD